MKIAAAVAALALASPLAAFAQTPDHVVSRTVVTHHEARLGRPVATKTIYRVERHRPAHHHLIRKVVIREPAHTKTVVIVRR